MSGWHTEKNLRACTGYKTFQPSCKTFHVYGLLRIPPENPQSIQVHSLDIGNGYIYKSTYADEILICDHMYEGVLCEIEIPTIEIQQNVLTDLETYRVPGMLDLKFEILDSENRLIENSLNNTLAIIDEIQESADDINEHIQNQTDMLLISQAKHTSLIIDHVGEVFNEVSGLKNFLIKTLKQSRELIIEDIRGFHGQVLGEINKQSQLIGEYVSMLAIQITENTFFQSLINIDTFVTKFDLALQYDEPSYSQEFSDFLFRHELELEGCKRALMLGITGNTFVDSLVSVRMRKLATTLGACSDSYHKQVNETQYNMVKLHATIHTMMLWQAYYTNSINRIGVINNQKAIDLTHIQNHFTHTFCDSFNNSELNGGGCHLYAVNIGLDVELNCTQEGKTVVDRIYGERVPVLQCQGPLPGSLDPVWSVDPEALICVDMCRDGEKMFDIGEEHQLSTPVPGFRWHNSSGQVVSSKTCEFNFTSGQSAWSVVLSVDIDECQETPGLCHSSEQHAMCENTVGSYTCECDVGYELSTAACPQGMSECCVDTNECESGNVGHVNCLTGIGYHFDKK